MNIIRFVPVVAVLLFAVSAAATAGSADTGTYDATTKSVLCVNSGLGICAVPIYALYSRDVRDYGDLQVVTFGFLRKLGREYVLFPDKEVAKFAVPEQGILLSGESGEFERVSKLYAGRYVDVRGKISVDEPSFYWATMVLDSPPTPRPMAVGDDGYIPAPRKPSKK